MQFGTSTINVSYTGELDSNTETGGSGTNYYIPLVPTYTSPTASNAPPGGNMITVTGGTGLTDTVTFSSPVQDFLMSFVSLGQPGVPVTYQFNTTAPISILSTGTGGVYGGSINLSVGHTSDGFDTITGEESDGVIQFGGSFSSISWTIPPPGEFWDGWTFGAVAEAPPTSPPTSPPPVSPPPPPVTSAVPLPAAAWMGLSLMGGMALINAKRKLRRA
jgi:hypothetical protein